MKKLISLVLVVAHLFLLFPVVSLDIGAESEQWDVINTKGITGEDIVAQAKKYIGAGYSNKDYKTRTGFTTPQKFDCSGLVYRVCREVGLVSSHKNSTMGVYDDAGRPLEGSNEAGYYITAHTGKQKNYGTKLTTAVNNYKESGDYSGFLPGDLLFFDYKSNGTGGTDHVGIYTANGKIINATSSKGVVETSLSQTGWPDGKLGNSLYDAVRLVNSNEAANSYLSKCTAYPTHVTIKTTKSTYVKSLPCSEKTDANSENVETANAGIQYEAIGLYKNTAGNLWYKVRAKNGSVGYIYAGDAAFVSEDTSDIVHSGITVPTSHTKGNSYPLTGTISSTYSKIDKISVYVYDAKGIKITGAEATVTGNNYTLKGSAIDNKTKFGSLAVGAHTYKVTVYFEYCYADSAKDMTTWSVPLRFYEKTFNVVSATGCSHSYSSKVTTAATCTTAGVKTYTCSKCNDSYTEAIAATGNHTYENACDADCNVCGATRTITHSWNNGQVTKVATCKEEGVKIYTCSVCGETKTEVIAKTTNHTYDNTCDKDCNVCGATRTTSHSWNNGQVTKVATCKEEGVKTFTCSICGGTKTEAIAKTEDHKFGNLAAIDGKNHKDTCSVCNKEVAQSHTFDSGKVTKPATCKEEGEKTVTCKGCGYAKTEAIAKTNGHTYDNACDADCNVCGATRTITHSWNNGQVTKVATCKEEGVKTFTCTVCGETKAEAVAKLTTHTWNDGEITIQATCSSYGQKFFTCVVCGNTKAESYIDPRAHQYDGRDDDHCNLCNQFRLIGCVGETLGVQITTKTDKGYTLTGSGSEFATVVFTGQSSIVIGSSGTYKKNYNLTFSKAGTYELLFVQEGTGSRTAFFTEITEHEWEFNKTVQPTCAQGGYDIYKCKHCGTTEQRNAAGAIGAHTWNDGTVTKEPTCKEEGVKTFTCTVCGERKTESIAKATNHTYDNACDKDCNVCGTTRTTSHTWNNGEVTKEPTCKEEGVKTFTCSVCGETKTEAIAKTNDHIYDNTCDKDCNVCGTTRTITHAFSAQWDKDGNGHWHTCTICGEKGGHAVHTPGAPATETTAQTCTICEYVIQEPLGPSYTPGDVDGVEGINDADAIYLLYSIFMPELYPVNQDCDFDGDGELTDRDAIYLLYHIFLPELYPIG